MVWFPKIHVFLVSQKKIQFYPTYLQSFQSKPIELCVLGKIWSKYFFSHFFKLLFSFTTSVSLPQVTWYWHGHLWLFRLLATIVHQLRLSIAWSSLPLGLLPVVMKCDQWLRSPEKRENSFFALARTVSRSGLYSKICIFEWFLAVSKWCLFIQIIFSKKKNRNPKTESKKASKSKSFCSPRDIVSAKPMN